jgi:chemotaxis protein methyltransferase CheR
VASDINSDVLHHCKKGVYSAERMRELTPALVTKYFLPVEGHPGRFRVKSYLKKYFILKKLNLIEKIRFEAPFDYIFCRNVLIYFDQDTQKLVIENLIANLDRLGYLFVGHSESLLHLTDRLESVFSSVYNVKE